MVRADSTGVVKDLEVCVEDSEVEGPPDKAKAKAKAARKAKAKAKANTGDEDMAKARAKVGRAKAKAAAIEDVVPAPPRGPMRRRQA